MPIRDIPTFITKHFFFIVFNYLGKIPPYQNLIAVFSPVVWACVAGSIVAITIALLVTLKVGKVCMFY